MILATDDFFFFKFYESMIKKIDDLGEEILIGQINSVT